MDNNIFSQKVRLLKKISKKSKTLVCRGRNKIKIKLESNYKKLDAFGTYHKNIVLKICICFTK